MDQVFLSYASQIHKVVVPAAGRGTRMRQPAPDVILDEAQSAMADRGIKAMIPINGKPFLSYVLSALADAGYEEACLVIAPHHEVIREHYTLTARRNGFASPGSFKMTHVAPRTRFYVPRRLWLAITS